MLKFLNGISIEDTEHGMLVRQYSEAYIARRWKLNRHVKELVETALYRIFGG